MGMDANAILVYGIDLSSLDWDEFRDWVENGSPGLEDSGLEIEYYCNYEEPMFILAAKESKQRAWYGSAKIVETRGPAVAWIRNLQKGWDLIAAMESKEPYSDKMPEFLPAWYMAPILSW